MDFTVSDKMKDLLARIRAIVTEHVSPAEHEVFELGFVEAAPVLERLRGVVKEAGLWGPQIPAELGGMELSLLEHGMVSEELGRSPLGHYVFGCQAPDAGNIEILHKYGSEVHHKRWLEPLVAGDIRSCFSMTEPEVAGSDPTLIRTRAVRARREPLGAVDDPVAGVEARAARERGRVQSHVTPGRRVAGDLPLRKTTWTFRSRTESSRPSMRSRRSSPST